MKTFLASVFTNQYLILLITAALGAALGKIKIKGFSLGGTGGIFVGIVIGWGLSTVALKVPEFSALIDANTGEPVLIPEAFMTFFLLMFICSIGLSVGNKLKSVLNLQGLKLVIIGVLIPIVSMALTWGCLKAAPALMGDNFNGYQISGLYSGAMTNTAAYGNSMAVINGMDNIKARYEGLTDEEKARVLEMIGADDTTPTSSLNDGQVEAFKGKAKANISLGYAISFPIGTIVIILAMVLFSAATKRERAKEDSANKTAEEHNNSFPAVSKKPVFFDAVVFGIVFFFGIVLGSIKIPLGNSVSFTLSPVGGILVSSLVFSNIPRLGPINMVSHPQVLAFMREFSLIFFMSIAGLSYGYDVISAFSGSGLVLVVMAIVIEVAAVLVAVVIGRLLKIKWARLGGAICGGCTSSVGLGTAISTMGHDEPALGYGVAQPFAILANVLLISLFHSSFFI